MSTYRNWILDVQLTNVRSIGAAVTMKGLQNVRGNNITILGCSSDNGVSSDMNCGLVLDKTLKNVRLYNVVSKDGSRYGVYCNTPVQDVTIHKLTTSGNTLGGVRSSSGELKIYNADISETTKYAFVGTYEHMGTLVFINYLGVANSHVIVSPLGTIESEETVRHTASGISWKMTPTSIADGVGAPLTLHVADILVTAGVESSWTIWLMRSSTAVVGKFYIPPCVGGITAEVSDTINASPGAWEQQTLTFTPTDTAVVPVYVDCLHIGTGESLYVDDFSLGA
ncbi:MAG: hypothetical protein LC687_03120 [Actinobacteria bacterium]|nr:hypothetical protein [Actinomycetota bacterium]